MYKMHRGETARGSKGRGGQCCGSQTDRQSMTQVEGGQYPREACVALKKPVEVHNLTPAGKPAPRAGSASLPPGTRQRVAARALLLGSVEREATQHGGRVAGPSAQRKAERGGRGTERKASEKGEAGARTRVPGPGSAVWSPLSLHVGVIGSPGADA